MKRLTCLLLAVLLAACTSTPETTLTPKAELRSPDGLLHLSFYLSGEGTPRYALERDGVPVVTPSRLGFRLRGVVKAENLSYNADGTISKEDGAPSIAFDRDFELLGVETDTFDEVWEPVWGEESHIRNHSRALMRK